MKTIREFWIARIKDYDSISDIKPPENAMHKDKYIRVVAVDDLQFELGMGLTRYSELCAQLNEANEALKFYGEQSNWRIVYQVNANFKPAIKSDDIDNFNQPNPELGGAGGKTARAYLNKWKVK